VLCALSISIAVGARAADIVEWVKIPGGRFLMGTDDLSANAKPVHRVRIKGFEMAKAPVTFGQYGDCVKAGACTPIAEPCAPSFDGFKGDDQPVVCVTWEQAAVFSRWVGGRLPSEAEWEYAARDAGHDSKYPWGNETPTCELAVMDEGGRGCGRGATWPVCSKTKGNTPQGLCDMAGNVWEMTEDRWHRSYRGAPANGSAWGGSDGRFRVNRGGSWHSDAVALRSAARNYDVENPKGDDVGFRPVRSATPAAPR
jgi:formylglycine-generating enzyme required for sulfatase activity